MCCWPCFTGIPQNTTHTSIVGITTTLRGETTASQNWQKVSKLFPSWSYSGCCGIETPTTLSNKIIKIAKRTDFFDFFTTNNIIGSMSGMDTFDTSPLNFLHLKSVSGFRGPLMFEQGLCTQKPQAWHLRVNPNTLIAHTTGKFASIHWFRGIMNTNSYQHLHADP